jgi:hypothetical protein
VSHRQAIACGLVFRPRGGKECAESAVVVADRVTCAGEGTMIVATRLAGKACWMLVRGEEGVAGSLMGVGGVVGAASAHRQSLPQSHHLSGSPLQGVCATLDCEAALAWDGTQSGQGDREGVFVEPSVGCSACCSCCAHGHVSCAFETEA